MLGKIVQSVEDERGRIASDLHDDTVQVLVASLISIDRLGKSIDPENTRSHELLAKVRATLAAATERTRHLIFELRPQLLEAEGVVPAIAEIASHAGREAGFAVDIDGGNVRYEPAVEALLYRVHAGGGHQRPQAQPCRPPALLGAPDRRRRASARSQTTESGSASMTRWSARAEQLSFGLSTILELVRLAGGRVDVDIARTGDGTVVTIRLPDRLTARATTTPAALQPT